MTLQEYVDSIKEKRIAVIGAGVSNMPLIRLLLENGCEVTVCDKRSFPEMGQKGDTSSDETEQAINKLAPKLHLALDGVQDPGNLGTIIRIADWFGIDTIFCSHDTADAWNPKVVQATMGSIARVHIIYMDLAELLSHTTLPVYGTLLDGTDIYRQELTPEGIIIMGNEGNGISAPIRQLITRKLLIPAFREGAESLNVAIATAITCSEFRRRV